LISNEALTEIIDDAHRGSAIDRRRN
jgi:hypothetical protein